MNTDLEAEKLIRLRRIKVKNYRRILDKIRGLTKERVLVIVNFKGATRR